MAAAAHSFKAVLLRPAAALPRPARSMQPVLVAFAPLSTTSAAAAAASGVKSRRDIVKPTKKTFNKKRLGVENVRKPAPGERRAFRKRITLSSNSALAVEGLQLLEAGVLADAASAATVVRLPDPVVDQLRTLGAFRPGQSWGLFRTPHVLVRKETVNMVARMERAVAAKEVARIVLTGSRASGKSTALVQAMSHALKNEWVVINIPEAQDLVNAHTDYSPVPNSEPMQFTQPTYTLNLLQNILKANKATLEKLKVEQKSSLTGGLLEGASLADLVTNIREPDAAWPGFCALWSELTLPGRPPVLMALDGLTFANKDSQYRDPAFNKVHAHNLTLLGHFFRALAGAAPMPNGGAVIAADSASNTPARHPSEALVLAQLEAGQAGRAVPAPDPYLRGYDNKVYDALRNCHVVRLEGVSKPEARALMEYWGASGLVRSALTAELVAQNWALGGHGNIGEMERVVLQNLKM
ncbi:mitochondrial ribosomal protein DAP3, putative [Cordyceps militaris CM01]|uniref:Small ribosomal subunit protein mS29 n=1 Tax=Cordyceps militaris (strain CM01) TaxID=983644 RepID=G3JKH7_CORMM|nr:mitochondrial ribosomal protein DAP3, putative [Cordyceps militaris CM01]EGX91416.1 mitochondrial ribosomal protein DAP3, putative [Cordyceps militaris CM01]